MCIQMSASIQLSNSTAIIRLPYRRLQAYILIAIFHMSCMYMCVCSTSQVFIWLLSLLHSAYSTRSRQSTAHRRISGQRQCAVKRSHTHTQKHIANELARQRLSKYRHMQDTYAYTVVASESESKKIHCHRTLHNGLRL